MTNESNNVDSKPTSKCKTQIQIKFTNLADTLLNVPLTCTLGDQSQEKTLEEEGETEISFIFKFKGDKKVKVIQLEGKDDKAKPTPAEVYCPQPNETLTGNFSSEDGTISQAISVTVVKSKGNKPTKVTYDMSGAGTPEEPPV